MSEQPSGRTGSSGAQRVEPRTARPDQAFGEENSAIATDAQPAGPAELEQILQDLTMMVSNSRSVPFSSNVLVCGDALLGLLRQAMYAVPRDVAEARKVLAERTRLLARARAHAEAIVERAYEDRKELLGNSEISQAARDHAAQMVGQVRHETEQLQLRAREEAERVLAEAHAKASAMEQEAEQFVNDRLHRLQVTLERALETVASGRQQLEVEQSGTAASE